MRLARYNFRHVRLDLMSLFSLDMFFLKSMEYYPPVPNRAMTVMHTSSSSYWSFRFLLNNNFIDYQHSVLEARVRTDNDCTALLFFECDALCLHLREEPVCGTPPPESLQDHSFLSCFSSSCINSTSGTLPPPVPILEVNAWQIPSSAIFIRESFG